MVIPFQRSDGCSKSSKGFSKRPRVSLKEIHVVSAERVERSRARPQSVAALEGARPRDELPGLVA